MRPTTVLFGLTLALTFALAGCTSPGDHEEDIMLVEIVSISDGFEPAEITITVGDTVTWKNVDSFEHTVTADDDSFDSGALGTGETWEHTFDEAGTFEYHCTPHPNMMAKVIVENATAE